MPYRLWRNVDDMLIGGKRAAWRFLYAVVASSSLASTTEIKVIEGKLLKV